jgi:large subunit ribosomal protein L21
MYAVIVTGGAQHRVSEGEVLKVEKIDGAEPGSRVEFAEVLMVRDATDLRIGEPHVANARVIATVLRNGRGEKVRVFKKKKRKHYRRTRGHRQAYTALRIDQIVAG